MKQWYEDEKKPDELVHVKNNDSDKILLELEELLIFKWKWVFNLDTSYKRNLRAFPCIVIYI